MKPIRIIDDKFNLLGEIDNYESFILTRNWHTIGEFQLVTNLHVKNAEHLKEGNLIVPGNDVSKACIILHRELILGEDGKGSEKITVQGATLEGILDRRITIPPIGKSHEYINATAESVMKQLIRSNVISPVDSRRRINQLSNAADLQRGLKLIWQTRYKQLHEELERISILSGLGWFVHLDYEQKRWMFDVKPGRNLTVGQSLLSPVIFSPEFNTVQSQHFVDSVLDYSSIAYVAGQGEGVERRVIEVGQNTSGLNRFEMFVDARDIDEQDDDEKPRPVKDIIAELTQRGNEKLAEVARIRTFEIENLTKSPFKYEEDWNLGDIVTVQNLNWGVTMDSRITGVTEVYEASGFRLNATFGNDLPTMNKKMKREINQVSTDVRR